MEANVQNPALMKRSRVVSLAFVTCLSVIGWFVYHEHNPLRKYGVYYGINPGGSETFTHLQFYRTRNGEAMKGPEITGSLLYVTYQDVNEDGVPEIIVKSQANKTYKAVLRLNQGNTGASDFEVLENNCLNIDYPVSGMHWP